MASASAWAARGMATAVAVAVAVAACGRSPGGPADGAPGGPEGPGAPGATQLDAEVIGLDTESVYSGAFGALSDSPIDLRLVLGWGTAGRHAKAEIGQGSASGSAPAGDAGGTGTDGPGTSGDRPSTTYVVVAEDTGCRTPTGAELWRDGDDLQARFTGDRDDLQCFVPVISIAQFAVDAGAVRGVATIGGEAPVDPLGPGRLEAFVEIGTALRLGPDVIEPTRLDDRPRVESLYGALVRSRANDLEQVRAALDGEPAEGMTGLAFVLTGCAEDGAVLVVSPTSIEAELVGDENVMCDAPVYFLAVFHLPDEYGPS